VQQPVRVVVDAQVAAEFQRGDVGFGLANEIKGRNQTALIALEPPTIAKPMLVA
jgi:hypothetical protein